jgi:hypothetical protein
MTRLMLGRALLAALALSGCATTRYQWSSGAGRDCFWSCQSIVNTRNASCGGPSLAPNLLCTSMCMNQGKQCASSCPDLRQVS